MKKIEVKILTPGGLYKETMASIINVISEDRRRVILPEHMPLVMILTIGKMELEEERRETYAVAGGMLYFSDNKCTILTPAIEKKDDIDIARATKAKERAEGHLKDPNSDLKRAKLALERALNRLNVHSL